MARGRPRKIIEPKIVVEPKVIIPDPIPEGDMVQPIIVEKKTHYSCGCKVIPINAERDKPKCIKHGVA